MIDFPSNPTPGVTTVTVGRKKWKCSGIDGSGKGIWDLVSTPDSFADEVTQGVEALRAMTDVAPPSLTSSTPGREWIDPETMKRYTVIQDANGTHLIEVAGFYYVDDAVTSQQATKAASDAAASAAAAALAVGTAQFGTYTALRAYTGTSKSAYVTGYLVTAAPAGIAGLFTVDDSDTTSADNGGTIIVAANGKRWKRVFNGAVDAAWFGAMADGITDDTTALTAASTYAFGRGRALSLPGKAYKLTGTLDWTAYANIVVYGSGWASAPTQNVGTQLIQFTDNIPIIRVTARPDIQCLSLRYQNQQTVAQTGAIGVEMNKLSGAYFRNVRVFCANISYGVPQVGFGTDGANWIFNSSFIGVESWQASHTHYDFRGINGGSTNCYFGPLYINGMGSLDFGTVGQTCEYGIRATNCTGYHFTAVSIDGLTFNQTLIDLVNNCKVAFTTLRFESVRTTLNGGYWINMGGSHAQLNIGLLELYRIRSQASDGVNTTTIVRANATDFNVNIDQVRVAIAEVTTGTKRFFRAGGTSENSEFNNSQFYDPDGIFPGPWSDDTGRTVPPIRTFDGKRISERNGNGLAGTTSSRTIFLQTNQAPGSTAWSAAGGMGTKPWLAGDRIIVQDAGDLGRVLEWRCYASGTPGSWAPSAFVGGQGSMNYPGDADYTFTPLVSRGNVYYGTTLTANRTITFDPTGAWNGLRVLVTRPAAGNFTLDVGGFATLNPGDWCEIGYDGGAYRPLRMGFNFAASTAASRIATDTIPLDKRLTAVDKGGIGDFNPDGMLFLFCGDSTTEQMNAYTGTMKDMRKQGQPFANIAGTINFGGSGHRLQDWVEGAAAAIPTIPKPEGAVSTWDYWLHKPTGAVTLNTALAWRAANEASTPVTWVICYGINDLILYNSMGNQTQAQITAAMAGYLRTAIGRIQTANPRDIIVLRIPNPMVARPYNAGAGFPSSSAYPTFGTDATADQALVEKWNQALRAAYLSLQNQFVRTVVYDSWTRVFASSDTTKLAGTEVPFLGDLVHPSGEGYFGVQRELGTLLLKPTQRTSLSRRINAERTATARGGVAWDYYPAYFEDNPLYRLVLETTTVNMGTNYIDLGIDYTTFQTLLVGGATFYLQLGDRCAQVFSNWSAGAQAANTRLLSVAPNAAMQAAGTVSQPCKLWVLQTRSLVSNDAYVESQVATSRQYYPVTLGAGNGYIDIGVSNKVYPRFSTKYLGAMTGAKLAVGGTVNAVLDLSTANISRNGTTAQRTMRAVLSGDYTAYAGQPAALFFDDDRPVPAAFERYIGQATVIQHAQNQKGYVYVDQTWSDGGTFSVGMINPLAQAVTVDVYSLVYPNRTLVGTITVAANSGGANLATGNPTQVNKGVVYEFVITSATSQTVPIVGKLLPN